MPAEEKFVPFCLPDITDGEIEQMTQCLRSGWLAKGPMTIAFEKQFADFVGAKYAVGMNSCTAALHIALLAAGIGPGDEVITTPMTFAASANTICHVGATPVFADIDPVTACIDPEKLEAAITPKTKAVVPVHYGGQACDLDRIYEIAERHHLFVSEDAAHAVYSQYKGRPIGYAPYGAASFSFYATKNLATGEGGMLTTEDEEIANRARVLVTHGMSRNAWNRYAKGGSWKYDIEDFGYKYNMFDLQAALGQVQLARLPEMQARREKVVDKYREILSQCPAFELAESAPWTTRNAWHLFALRLNLDRLTIDRDRFIEELNAAGVGTSVHFIPVHLMSAYRKTFGYQEGDFPETERYFERIISLPLYSTLSLEDAAWVAQTAISIAEKYKR